MGRSPCCSQEGLNRGAWTAQEDKILKEYINVHGQGKWRNLPQRAGLKRCGKSCRLRWLNYLRPDIKRGNISPDEEELIIRLHKLLGNRWSLIAGRLPGRTDNEIKNYWNTNLGKKMNNTGTTNSSSSHHQQIENNNNNNINVMMEEAKVTSTPSLSSLSPNNNNDSKSHHHSLLIHTKASKCSNKLLLVEPLPHQYSSSVPKPPSKNKASSVHGAEDHHHHDSTTDQPMVLVDNKDIILRNESTNKSGDDHRELLTTDLLLDFDIGDICLPDLLNSDFAEICNFGYKNNNGNGEDLLFPFSEQMIVSSNGGILKDNFCDDETDDVVVENNFCEEW